MICEKGRGWRGVYRLTRGTIADNARSAFGTRRSDAERMRRTEAPNGDDLWWPVVVYTPGV
jgi:hypothetical protein